jgi:hypothetical protein
MDEPLDEREIYPIGNGWYASRSTRSGHITTDPAISSSQPVSIEQPTSTTHSAYETQNPCKRGWHDELLDQPNQDQHNECQQPPNQDERSIRSWKTDYFPYNKSSHDSQLPGNKIPRRHNTNDGPETQLPGNGIPHKQNNNYRHGAQPPRDPQQDAEMTFKALVDSLANNASSKLTDPSTQRSRRRTKAALFRILHLAQRKWYQRGKSTRPSKLRPKRKGELGRKVPEHIAQDISGLRSDLYDLWDNHHVVVRRLDDFEELEKRIDMIENLLLGLSGRLRKLENAGQIKFPARPVA